MSLLVGVGGADELEEPLARLVNGERARSALQTDAGQTR
jgi:hypothetical protein